MYQVSIFSLVWFLRHRGPILFSVFPIWLPHHVTYDVIIIIKTFYMSNRTNGENFVLISKVVTEKNTNVLCGQIDKETDPNVILSPLARVMKHN